MVIKHKGPKGGGLGKLKPVRDEAKKAAIKYGLDFFDTIFEKLDYEEMNVVAAKGGFPRRYPHWRFGMEYERLRKSYRYGLHKIYEMVINNDPCYAYLLESNNIVDQKVVISHVFGHCDFFKNNVNFSKTNRKMMDAMANHAVRIERYIQKYGLDAIESFIDTCIVIDDLIDPHSVFIKRREDLKKEMFSQIKGGDRPIAQKIPSKEYMNGYVNPPEAVKKEQEKLDEKYEDKKMVKHKQKFPENPEKDVLFFLIEHAPLEDWQRDVLWMIREEAYYFAPQAETKIMNEGWATYWHEKICTEILLTDADIVDFADHHSGTIAAHQGQINPYRLGWQLWKDIEDRWNKGKFGKEYDDCRDYASLKNWDKKLGLGEQKMFEVRRVFNDITFIDEFFTEEFCNESKYFTYEYDKEMGVYRIADKNWKKVKDALLFSLTNQGKPFIYVVNGNHNNRGELLLAHRHEGRDLQITKAKETLRCLYNIWKRPVHIETIVDGKEKTLSCDTKKPHVLELPIQ